MTNSPEIRHINVDSDFKVLLSFKNGNIPTHPWQIVLYTSNTDAFNMYSSGFDGNAYHKCIPVDDSSILVMVDSHRLRSGTLQYKLIANIPDADFSDGVMDVVTPGNTSVCLWDGPSDDYKLPIWMEAILAQFLRGESAYEVAVRNGFVGSEAEWLESLHIPLVNLPGEREDAAMSQKGATDLAGQTLREANEQADKLANKALDDAKKYTDDNQSAVAEMIATHNASGAAHDDIRGAVQVAIQKFSDYYTKTETYTKEEVNQQIASLSTARFEVVATLPEAGETNVIYLLPKSPAQDNNAYDEYIYIAETWEVIGTTEIDLSQYATREWVQGFVSELQQQIRGKVDAVPGKGLSTNDYSAQDKAEVAKIAGKEDAQIIETIPGASVALDVVGGHTYLCGEVASLVISSVEDSPRSAVIRFRSGAVATSLTLPDALRVAGYARPEANREYELDIANRLAYINRF